MDLQLPWQDSLGGCLHELLGRDKEAHRLRSGRPPIINDYVSGTENKFQENPRDSLRTSSFELGIQFFTIGNE